MTRLVIVSNRLPINIIKENDELHIKTSAGGLATGLKSYHTSNDSVWIGWPGLIPESSKEEKEVSKLLKKQQYSPVFLTEELIENYYDGFSNTTLWPLFHYFSQYAEFKNRFWEAFIEVNQLFAEKIISEANEGDTVWIHDYQLLLLPSMLRETRPDLKIGFFLHIPFPSYEIIRILPWREEILQGMLGADLIGFHTYDYARHFISSVKRLLGYDVDFNTIHYEDRHIRVDVFPMGIDYEKFETTAIKTQSKPIQERSKTHRDIDRFLMSSPDRKLVLSIDRLDYTKGIPERLHAYRYFLQNYPEYREKVSLVLLSVPSRTDVDQYQQLKNEVDLLVGSINGELGTINWTPVIYFYRSMPFESLIELYSSCDIALLTPLRDGMNLVAKEFIASKTNHRGCLILSEMAGASKEMGEAILVNPNNIVETGKAIHAALTMDEEEQEKSMRTMQKRIKQYDVHRWATEFMTELEETTSNNIDKHAKRVTDKVKDRIKSEFDNAKKRTLFLDYDGTLQRFFNLPQAAVPDAELYTLLDKIANLPNTELVLISGRDKITFDAWFGDRNYTLIAEHGAWLKNKNEEWKERRPNHPEWKESIMPVLESYVYRTPGSLIEEKTYSLVWHYRKADVELGAMRALDLVHVVSNLILNQDLEILEGSKVIEIKVSGINKGVAAHEFLTENPSDFILSMGDDWTDEFMFKELPESAHTIKVGTDNSEAKYFVDNQKVVRGFLESIVNEATSKKAK